MDDKQKTTTATPDTTAPVSDTAKDTAVAETTIESKQSESSDTRPAESKPAADTNPQVAVVEPEPVVASIEGMPEPASAATTAPKKSHALTIVAILLVVFALAAVWFRLEKEGRVDTSFFSSMIAAQNAGATVATVNGEVIANGDLAISIEQLEQAAAMQGMDPADAQVQAEIRSQAIEMLVNTKLLEQAAETEGIVIPEEDVLARMEQIEFDAGGADVLAERMAEYDISQETFQEDVTIELTIGRLLDEVVFATSDLAVTEEEVNGLYEGAGGAEAGLPALEEVRPQLEAQIRQSKEQAAVDAYLAELRADADIDISS